jgi:hypothetical protein
MMKKIISKALTWSGILLAVPGVLAALPGATLVFLGEAIEEGDCNEKVRKGIEKEKNERDRGKQ